MQLNDLTLTQDAYLEDDFQSAHATDKEGNEYMVHWEITADDFENLEDQSAACDWDNPIFITKIQETQNEINT